MKALMSFSSFKLGGGGGRKFIEGTDKDEIMQKVQAEMNEISAMYMASCVENEAISEERYTFSQEVSVEFEDGSFDFLNAQYGAADFYRTYDESVLYSLHFEIPVFPGKKTDVGIRMPKGKTYNVRSAARAIAKLMQQKAPDLYLLSELVAVPFTLHLTHPDGEVEEHTFTLAGQNPTLDTTEWEGRAA